MRHLRPYRAGTAVAAAMLATAPMGVAHAQALRGRVVTADSSRGIAGVVVLLRDSANREVASALSDQGGAFVVPNAPAGSARIRTLRIGYAPGEFGPFTLPSRTGAPLVLALRGIPTSLAAVRVTGENGCRSVGEGTPASVAVWEAARAALVATVLTRSATRPAVTLTEYERTADPRTQRIVRQRLWQQSGESTRPFRSALTPDEHAARGYAIADSSGVTYLAPDADVLLSESFATTHCFQLTESSSDTTRIGLAFRPADSSREIVDVAGTLWLDRRTSELRTLEFQYTGVDPALARAGAGGQMRFVRLPSGIWVITRWDIHAPRLALSREFVAGGAGSLSATGGVTSRAATRSTVVELWKFGGELNAVRLDGTLVWSSPAGRVAGVVTDDGSGLPVAGAPVTLRGTDYATRTDSAGAFTLLGVLPGRYELEARSPALALLGAAASASTEITVEDSATRSVVIRLPALTRALARACAADGNAALADDGGAIQGVVRAMSGAPLAGATVTASWLASAELRRGAGVSVEVAARRIEATARAGDDGAFRLCGVPMHRDVRVVGSRDSLRSTSVHARLASESPLAAVELIATATGARYTADGLSSLEGAVTDDAGRPLGGVEVQVIGGDASRSDSAGRYRIGGLADGTYLLRVRQLGRVAVLHSIQVAAGERMTHDVQLRRADAVLDTIRVRGASTSSLADPTGFERRRGNGQGVYVTDDQIEHRRATTTDQLLRGMRGLRLERRNGGVIAVLDRGEQSILEIQTGQRLMCNGVQVLVDGVAAPQPFDVNQIPVASIRAVEYYPGAATLPPELRSARSACGTIVIWTRA